MQLKALYLKSINCFIKNYNFPIPSSSSFFLFLNTTLTIYIILFKKCKTKGLKFANSMPFIAPILFLSFYVFSVFLHPSFSLILPLNFSNFFALFTPNLKQPTQHGFMVDIRLFMRFMVRFTNHKLALWRVIITPCFIDHFKKIKSTITAT